ncbi:MAG: phosphoglycolate phosphatase [Burkholderiales bacterium]
MSEHPNSIQNTSNDGHLGAEVLGNDRLAETSVGDLSAKVEAKKVRYRAKPKFPLPIQAKALLLDLDGTMLDTVGDITTAVNRMRAAFGFGPLDLPLVRNFIGRGTANLVSQSMKNSVGELGATASKVAIAQFEKQYEACLADVSRAFPGVFEGLELFREKGFRLGCVTNKAERFTLPLLEKTGLAPYFELVVSGDSLDEKKPHPLPLRHAADFFAARIDEVIMIGDSMHDAAAARAAGCPVFIVPYGYNEGQELRGLDCDAFIDDLPSALKYVKVGV